MLLARVDSMSGLVNKTIASSSNYMCKMKISQLAQSHCNFLSRIDTPSSFVTVPSIKAFVDAVVAITHY